MSWAFSFTAQAHLCSIHGCGDVVYALRFPNGLARSEGARNGSFGPVRKALTAEVKCRYFVGWNSEH